MKPILALLFLGVFVGVTVLIESRQPLPTRSPASIPEATSERPSDTSRSDPEPERRLMPNAQASNPVIATAYERGLHAKTEADRLEVVAALEAAQDYDAMIDLYRIWQNLEDEETYRSRLAILKTLALVDDAYYAEELILQVVAGESVENDGTKLLHHAGTQIATNVWPRQDVFYDAGYDGLLDRVVHRFQVETPRAQHTLMIALTFADPRNLSWEFLRIYENSTDYWLRVNLITNAALRKDPEPALLMARDAFFSSQGSPETCLRYARVCCKAMGPVAERHPRFRSRAIELILEIVRRYPEDLAISKTAYEIVASWSPEDLELVESALALHANDKG